MTIFMESASLFIYLFKAFDDSFSSSIDLTSMPQPPQPMNEEIPNEEIKTEETENILRRIKEGILALKQTEPGIFFIFYFGTHKNISLRICAD